MALREAADALYLDDALTRDSHRARRLIVSLAVTALAIACAGQSNSSSGQSPTAPGTSSSGDTPNPAPAGAEVEFTGSLTSISSSAPGATLVVAGRTVYTNGATIVRRRGDSIAFSSLRVGQTVDVRGTSESSGSVLANRLTIEDDAAAEQEIEFSGTVPSISGSGPGATLVVAGRTVLTSASTVVRRRGDPVGFDRIRVGQRVEIKGVQQGANVLATPHHARGRLTARNPLRVSCSSRIRGSRFHDR